jgi:hypothetical protein
MQRMWVAEPMHDARCVTSNDLRCLRKPAERRSWDGCQSGRSSNGPCPDHGRHHLALQKRYKYGSEGHHPFLVTNSESIRLPPRPYSHPTVHQPPSRGHGSPADSSGPPGPRPHLSRRPSLPKQARRLRNPAQPMGIPRWHTFLGPVCRVLGQQPTRPFRSGRGLRRVVCETAWQAPSVAH